ncbi:hypothetical protein F8M41_005270 [Gigaspora margarita]|uniref:Transposase Tc1-like domain-containing protein n=1 Tax=Gigaspora margarita TaxID=4874 RepID=A0A8H4EV68_GIGMA|nr:hypothetical protein F8M41_005270 [Gigaspora margarita]
MDCSTSKTGNIKLSKHTEHLQLFDPEQKKLLDKIAKKNRTATSKELTKVLDNTYYRLNIVPRTVQENLQDLGYQVTVSCAISLLKKRL